MGGEVWVGVKKDKNEIIEVGGGVESSGVCGSGGYCVY